MRYQSHPEDVRRVLANLVEASGQLHSPALSPSSGMDLCLDDPDASAELTCGINRLIDRIRHFPFGDGDVETSQDLLCLMLMNVHGSFPSSFQH
jgi:hypothetical protein